MSIGALSTALGGMQAASARLDQAAGRIARAGTPAISTPKQTAPTATPTSGPPVAPLANPASANSNDLVGGVVDAKLAEISYKANAAVVKVASEMLGALLDTDT